MMARLGFAASLLNDECFRLDVYRECDGRRLLVLLYPSSSACEEALKRAAIPMVACEGEMIVLSVDVDCWESFMLEHLEVESREMHSVPLSQSLAL